MVLARIRRLLVLLLLFGLLRLQEPFGSDLNRGLQWWGLLMFVGQLAWAFKRLEVERLQDLE